MNKKLKKPIAKKAKANTHHKYEIGERIGKYKIVKEIPPVEKGGFRRFILQCTICGKYVIADVRSFSSYKKTNEKSQCLHRDVFARELAKYGIYENTMNYVNEEEESNMENKTNITSVDMKAMFVAYAISKNKKLIDDKVEEIILNGKLASVLSENAQKVIANKFTGAGDIDKDIENIVCSDEFPNEVISSIAGTYSAPVSEPKVQIKEVEKIVEKEVVKEVLPKGVLVVPDDVRPHVKYYLGKKGESETTILKYIIREFRAIDGCLNPDDKDISLIDVIKKLKEDSAELEQIKAQAKILQPSLNFKEPEPVEVKKEECIPKPAVQDTPTGTGKNIFEEFKKRVRSFYSFQGNKSKTLSREDLFKYMDADADKDEILKRALATGFLDQQYERYFLSFNERN